ncbi:porin OmpA [Gallibacterium salpingitidis]|uniref:porin OmpA n=1 Tax=Gallibacterium salpingitidis TaxID=505341 RepID=UPI00266F4C3B|nr:porin OmpA [Gallibacterium salpingitidis]WKT00836.1 porin OmpA [Gallibacterium salpingitidis]
MKKTAIALAISGLAFVSVAQAAPQANTFYAGAKAGWASFHYDVNQFDNEKGGSYGIHRNSETYGVFGGYQITDNFAVEAGYDFYGKLRMHQDDVRVRHTAHGLNLSLKASYPVAYVDGLDVYGRLGAALIRSDYTEHENGVKTESEHKLKVSPVFAAGVEYAILPELAARLEYQWVAKVGKVSQFNDDVSYSPSIGSVSLGLSYRFGQGQQAPAPAVEVVNKKFALSSDVLFAFGKANLKPEAAQSLDNLQQEISKVGSLSSVEVAGYTDRIGSDKYNLKLSQDRANTVANYLVSKSVSPDVIKAVGYGKANPVTGNTCDAVKGRKALIACLAPDRRVEVSVSGQHQTTVEK